MEAITVQKTYKYYTTEFDLEEGFLNGACIQFSGEYSLTKLIRTTLGLKRGAWGGRPTCHPQTPVVPVIKHC
jgi:hypothetical protein